MTYYIHRAPIKPRTTQGFWDHDFFIGPYSPDSLTNNLDKAIEAAKSLCKKDSNRFYVVVQYNSLDASNTKWVFDSRGWLNSY